MPPKEKLSGVPGERVTGAHGTFAQRCQQHLIFRVSIPRLGRNRFGATAAPLIAAVEVVLDRRRRSAEEFGHQVGLPNGHTPMFSAKSTQSIENKAISLYLQKSAKECAID